MAAKKKGNGETNVLNLSLRVLGYPEDDSDKWVAHCLEMDLLGYGDSFEEAFKDLGDLVRMQVSFALFKGQRSLLHNPAPARYFEIFNRLSDEYWSNYPDFQPEDPFRITSLVPSDPSEDPVQFEVTNA